MAAVAPGADPRTLDVTLAPKEQEAVRAAILGLDAWLDGMRQPGGYAGPVAHWWYDCLDYIGPGLDWRYEGIIIGYLNLWAATGQQTWLAKATRAGGDLMKGQLPSGNFRNSCFELNPNTGGTPHEAACDLALLRLAEALRSQGDKTWEQYLQAAERNLHEFYLARLWDPAVRSFRDDPDMASFVPNKSATLAEALFALARVREEPALVEQYALPTLDAVMEHQITTGALEGAIHQNSFGHRKVAKFFPYYIARCIPGLMEGLAWSGNDRYARCANRAACFILYQRYEDGSFPQVVYPGGHLNRYPQWIAAAGDMLHALDLSAAVGVVYDRTPTLRWLLDGQKPDGSIRTSFGFGRAVLKGTRTDPRDDMGVCGWADKAFRYLTNLMREDRIENATH